MCYAGKDRVQQQVPGSACHDTCHQEQRAIACGAVTSSFERARNISPNTISAGVLILEDYLQQQRPSLAGVWEMVCLGLAVDASGLKPTNAGLRSPNQLCKNQEGVTMWPAVPSP